jgi:hypothetical protein
LTSCFVLITLSIKTIEFLKILAWYQSDDNSGMMI